MAGTRGAWVIVVVVLFSVFKEETSSEVSDLLIEEEPNVLTTLDTENVDGQVELSTIDILSPAPPDIKLQRILKYLKFPTRRYFRKSTEHGSTLTSNKNLTEQESRENELKDEVTTASSELDAAEMSGSQKEDNEDIVDAKTKVDQVTQASEPSNPHPRGTVKFVRQKPPFIPTTMRQITYKTTTESSSSPEPTTQRIRKFLKRKKLTLPSPTLSVKPDKLDEAAETITDEDDHQDKLETNGVDLEALKDLAYSEQIDQEGLFKETDAEIDGQLFELGDTTESNLFLIDEHENITDSPLEKVTVLLPESFNVEDIEDGAKELEGSPQEYSTSRSLHATNDDEFINRQNSSTNSYDETVSSGSHGRGSHKRKYLIKKANDEVNRTEGTTTERNVSTEYLQENLYKAATVLPDPWEDLENPTSGRNKSSRSKETYVNEENYLARSDTTTEGVMISSAKTDPVFDQGSIPESVVYSPHSQEYITDSPLKKIAVLLPESFNVEDIEDGAKELEGSPQEYSTSRSLHATDDDEFINRQSSSTNSYEETVSSGSHGRGSHKRKYLIKKADNEVNRTEGTTTERNVSTEYPQENLNNNNKAATVLPDPSEDLENPTSERNTSSRGKETHDNVENYLARSDTSTERVMISSAKTDPVFDQGSIPESVVYSPHSQEYITDSPLEKIAVLLPESFNVEDIEDGAKELEGSPQEYSTSRSLHATDDDEFINRQSSSTNSYEETVSSGSHGRGSHKRKYLIKKADNEVNRTEGTTTERNVSTEYPQENLNNNNKAATVLPDPSEDLENPTSERNTSSRGKETHDNVENYLARSDTSTERVMISSAETDIGFDQENVSERVVFSPNSQEILNISTTEAITWTSGSANDTLTIPNTTETVIVSSRYEGGEGHDGQYPKTADDLEEVTTEKPLPSTHSQQNQNQSRTTEREDVVVNQFISSFESLNETSGNDALANTIINIGNVTVVTDETSTEIFPVYSQRQVEEAAKNTQRRQYLPKKTTTPSMYETEDTDSLEEPITDGVISKIDDPLSLKLIEMVEKTNEKDGFLAKDDLSYKAIEDSIPETEADELPTGKQDPIPEDIVTVDSEAGKNTQRRQYLSKKTTTPSMYETEDTDSLEEPNTDGVISFNKSAARDSISKTDDPLSLELIEMVENTNEKDDFLAKDDLSHKAVEESIPETEADELPTGKPDPIPVDIVTVDSDHWYGVTTTKTLTTPEAVDYVSAEYEEELDNAMEEVEEENTSLPTVEVEPVTEEIDDNEVKFNTATEEEVKEIVTVDPEHWYGVGNENELITESDETMTENDNGFGYMVNTDLNHFSTVGKTESTEDTTTGATVSLATNSGVKDDYESIEEESLQKGNGTDDLEPSTGYPTTEKDLFSAETEQITEVPSVEVDNANISSNEEPITTRDELSKMKDKLLTITRSKLPTTNTSNPEDIDQKVEGILSEIMNVVSVNFASVLNDLVRNMSKEANESSTSAVKGQSSNLQKKVEADVIETNEVVKDVASKLDDSTGIVEEYEDENATQTTNFETSTATNEGIMGDTGLVNITGNIEGIVLVGKVPYIERNIFGNQANFSVELKLKYETIFVPSDVEISEAQDHLSLNFTWPSPDSTYNYSLCLYLKESPSRYLIHKLQLNFAWAQVIARENELNATKDEFVVSLGEGIQITFSNLDFLRIGTESLSDVERASKNRGEKFLQLEIIFGVAVTVALVVLVVSVLLRSKTRGKASIESMNKSSAVP